MSPGRVIGASALGILIAGVAAAAGLSLWVESGAADFVSGRVDGVAIDESGDIRLAPAMELLLDGPEPRIWAVAADDRGRAYVSAGEEGKVLRIDPGGGDPVTIFDGPEIGAQALAWGPDGHLYVAAGPRGGVYRVPADHDGSELSPWFVPETIYVWDLAFAADGTLFVATGGEGKIFRVSPDGDGEVVYESPEPHVTSLAFDDEGRLLAGTEGSGYVYRVDAGGDVFVLYDAPLGEITDLVVSGGAIWASAYSAGGETDGDGEPARPSRAPGAGSASGAVYRIDADGHARAVWSSEDSGVHALGRMGEDLVAGTDGEGRLIRIAPDGGTSLLGRLDAAQVVALATAGDTLLAATSNVGRLYRLQPGYRRAGFYLSSVKDTGTVSRWGTIRWSVTAPEGTAVAVTTRSGNTEIPDDTWSDWAAPDTARGGAITSPPARFLQWRAGLTSDVDGVSPALHRVEAAYVTRNLPPRVESFDVHPPGVVYRQTASFEEGLPFTQVPASVSRALREMDPASAASASGGRGFLGRPLFIAGLQTLTWEAADPNDDALVYELEFRGETEGTWKPLAGPLEETLFVLDTRRLADGRYLARLRVSDARAHTPADALETTRTTRSFLVDNTSPEIEGLAATVTGDVVTIRGRARDATSLIEGIQYSVDGRPWHTVVAADGVADSPEEGIEIVLDGLSAGEHVVVVAVTDTALNEGAAKAVFTVSEQRER